MKDNTYYVVYKTEGRVGSCTLTIPCKLKYFEQIKFYSYYISRHYCDNQPAIIIDWRKIKRLDK